MGSSPPSLRRQRQGQKFRLLLREPLFVTELLEARQWKK